MRRLIGICALVAAAVPAAAADLELELPAGATMTAQETPGHGDFALAVAPFSDGMVETRAVTGGMNREAWQFPIRDFATSELMELFRRQLRSAGYMPLLDCADRRCGGFDFRFQINVLPEPAMHVDLGDFRYLSAARETPDGPEFVQLVVSRSLNSGYLDLTQIGVAGSREIVTATKAPEPEPATVELKGKVDDLLTNGFAALEDLTFGTGSSELSPGRFASLDGLAERLRQSPDLTIALVGHTDAVGSLSANVALSRRRAQSILERLVGEYGIARDRLEAEGVGYLAPVASNQTEEGRAKNRRVEVIITSTR